MPHLVSPLALPVLAYLLGSVPCGLVLGRLLKGIDLRTVGSGNIGTANAFRHLGKVGGTLTLLGDLAKSLIPVLLVSHLAEGDACTVAWWQVAVGVAAVIGHNNSIFLGFKGGKGIATTLGVLIGLNWHVALICFGVWGLGTALTRYSSVGSLSAAAALPVAMFLMSPAGTTDEARARLVYTGFSVVACLLAFYKHRKNIRNLRDGKELRLFSKPSET